MGPLSRRELIVGGFGWFPFFWRRNERTLSGIRFRVIRHGHSGRRYLRIHGNEETARQVLTDHMHRNAGQAYVVRNSTRNVSLRGGELDPNRMFSNEGAETNLRSLNPAWSDRDVAAALRELYLHRHEAVQSVLPDKGEILIALHNNGPGYSVADETPISDKVALNDASNPHEFCLCTDPGDFERLAGGPFNVVLQNTGPKDDDGSLSRLAAHLRFRYANIEAAHGNYQKQSEILNWLEKTLIRV